MSNVPSDFNPNDYKAFLFDLGEQFRQFIQEGLPTFNAAMANVEAALTAHGERLDLITNTQQMQSNTADMQGQFQATLLPIFESIAERLGAIDERLDRLAASYEALADR